MKSVLAGRSTRLLSLLAPLLLSSSMSTSSKVSLSRSLWSVSRDAALLSYTSPFVINLSRGSLPSTVYLSYIKQDSFFLLSFKKGFSSALNLNNNVNVNESESKFDANAKLEAMIKAIDDELNLHQSIVDTTYVTPIAQTLLYTDFIDDVCNCGGSIANICAALAPCMRLYSYIGKRILSNKSITNIHPYHDWIAQYSSDEFEASAITLESLLDHFADKENKTYNDLYPYYAKAMQLEYQFFTAQSGIATWNGVYKPELLAYDFDETLTSHQTSNLLCQRKGHNSDLYENKVYEDLLENYMSKYDKFMNDNLGSNLSSDFQVESYNTFIEKYTQFEDDLVAPVEQAKLLRGLTSTDISALAGQISLRPHAVATITHALHRYPALHSHVLSVSWSNKLIESTLALHYDNTCVKRTVINANELALDHEDRSTGEVRKSLTGPVHKGQLLRSIISENNLKHTVYIGDSLGDLDALLTADLGVIIGTSSTLRRVCGVYGVQLMPLDDVIYNHDAFTNTSKRLQPVLYVAESWSHIGFCLFGKTFANEWLSAWVDSITRSTSSGDGALQHVNYRINASSPPRVMVVAGSDSSGGAGIQADVKTCEGLGVFSTTAITALTAQNTLGVTAVAPTTATMLRAQMDAILSDIGADAVKTGMVLSLELAQEVARAVSSYGVRNIVVDPVMISTSGSSLMSHTEAEGIVRTLFPLATIVTPNIPEALSIIRWTDPTSTLTAIETVEDMEAAAKIIHTLGPAYLLIKGGHLSSRHASGYSVDVLYDGHSFEHIKGKFIAATNLHGTGCTLASAITAELARGHTIFTAVYLARAYLQSVLANSAASSLGNGKNGPMLHYSSHTTPSSVHGQHGDTCSGFEKKTNKLDLSLYAVTDTTLNARHGCSVVDVVTEAVAGGATVIQLREKNIDTRFICTLLLTLHKTYFIFNEMYYNLYMYICLCIHLLRGFVRIAIEALSVTRRSGVPLLINDRVDVALAADADGVHVGQSDM